ncbi:hypothetical protein CLOP_g21282 [Closterium sp. NIES-67]|nr:hypothetical protein CLOP_g21282 [Closterium sp. NIES-67]
MFWKELMSLLMTRLAMSSAYHPQTDRQTEHLNQIVEQLLRAGCKDNIFKWDLHLPVLEFAYNNATHAATGQTPFFLCYGCNPLTPQKPTASATLPGRFTTPSMSNFRSPTKIPTRTSLDANRRRHRPSSSMMNPSMRSSPCLNTAIVGKAPWSFSSSGRVMILLRIL